MLSCVNPKLTFPTFNVVELISVAVTVVAQTLSHRFAVLPKLYVLFASGITSLAISALIVMLSVFASPNVMLPFAEIFPVACKLPVTFVSANSSMVPVPFASISKLALDSFVEIVFPTRVIESIVNLF